MKDAEVATRHDVSPETAIDAILGHGGPILLDLDETLYLRNSTEDLHRLGASAPGRPCC